jgi:hypothetical protein
MSRLRANDLRTAVLFLALGASIGAWSRAYATTEAEAVDELMAVLGASLPCTRYAVAWLEALPTRIEHRCDVSIEKATFLGGDAPAGRVYYTIDMQVARNRYTSVYRFGGTPNSAVVLAQFLASFTAIAGPEDRTRQHFSPLIVYSINSAPLLPLASMVAGPQVLEARKGLAFPP